MVKIPFPFDPSIYLMVPEKKPILPEDVEKLNARINKLEATNTELRIKINRVIMENGNLKDS